VTTTNEWAIRREHILANMQLVMGPLPDPSRQVPLALQTLSAAKVANYALTKITFAVEKNDRAYAYLLIPDHPAGARLPAMLCLHQTYAAGKEEPAAVSGSANLHYAAELAERGYVTLAPDYLGYGEYRVDEYKEGYLSGTMKGIWNHMRAVDLLQSLP